MFDNDYFTEMKRLREKPINVRTENEQQKIYTFEDSLRSFGPCPHCGWNHSYYEAHSTWEPGVLGGYKCPNTFELIEDVMTMTGEKYWIRVDKIGEDGVELVSQLHKQKYYEQKQS